MNKPLSTPTKAKKIASHLHFGRKSVLVMAVAVFWVTFVAITAWQLVDSVNQEAEKVFANRRSQIDFLLKMSSGLLAEGNTAGLEPILREARALYLTDFFILQKLTDPQAPSQTETVFWDSISGDQKSLELDYVNLNIFIQTPNVGWKTIQILDYKLTLGIVVSKEGAAKRVLQLYWKTLLRDILTVTIALALILWLVLKDIITLTKALENRDKEAIKNLKGLSSEAQALLSATQAFETLDEEQKLQLELFGGTVGPAIMHELKSGRNAPYSFDTTVVRVDLNGYTRMFLDKKDEYVVDILNRYFRAAREIIERHSGLVYQYVGDEIVFHIKHHPGTDPNLQALACIRSLFHEAEKIERGLPPGADHQFRLKAALSHGSLKFVSLDKGHALTGVPLIESVRLLSNIGGREQQTCALRKPEDSKAQALISKSEELIQDLKGLDEQVSVIHVLEFTPFEELYKQNPEHIHLLRTDEDVDKLISKMESNFNAGITDTAHQVLTMMKTWRGTTPGPTVLHHLNLMLKAAFEASQKGRMHDLLIASLVMVIPRFVKPEVMTEELLTTLAKCLEHKNPRTVANTIIALSNYTSAEDKPTHTSFNYSKIKRFYNHANNRVAADALYACGMIKLDWDVATGLANMMSSDSELHKRSGEWVSKALLTFYGDKDPIFASTNPVLKKIRKALSEFEQKNPKTDSGNNSGTKIAA